MVGFHRLSVLIVTMRQLPDLHLAMKLGKTFGLPAIFRASCQLSTESWGQDLQLR
jgi:hypothetical protein